MKLSTEDLIIQIQKHKDGIAQHRDALRVIAEDLEAIDYSASAAVDELESVVDILSQYV